MSSQQATTPGAVFLSYAREDSEAARRIADALRAFGVEVWFDQAELRGGDAWDAKIRRQIRDCTLFVPVVSAKTQARGEGYFRREWKLAAERTHDMAASRAFLVPVVVDDTAETRAEVPEEFMRVQWTRLTNGVPSPEFVAQVKRLLDAPHARSEPVAGAARGQSSLPANAGPGIARRTEKKSGRWIEIVAGLVVLVLAIATWLKLREPTDSIQTPRPDVAAAAKPKPAPAKSIAVLPFENLSRDPQNDVFTDGMHDDVITALTKIHDLTVISRSSVLSYKGATRNLRAIAGELGVAHVLEGSVQREGSRIKLNVQLTDAQTSHQLWAHHYTEEITDTFAVQEKLADAITSALQARFSPEERTLIARRVTENQEAYELYMRASRIEESGSQRKPQSWAESIALYEQAVAKDLKFALAYAKLSAAHGLFYWFSDWDQTPARRDKAKAALDAAERLAPEAPETMVARGVYAYRCETDFERALAHHLAAERELPNDAELQDHIGATLRRLGRLPEAAERFQRGVALNPRSLPVAESYVQTLFYLCRFAEVCQFVQQKRTIFPNSLILEQSDAHARFALDDDGNRYAAALVKLRASGLLTYFETRCIGDLTAAEGALAREVATGRTADPLGARRPVSLLQAQMAFLRGKHDDARRFGAEALKDLAAQTPGPRGVQNHSALTALAFAYAGREAEAVPLADQAYAAIVARDKLQAMSEVLVTAETFVVLGKRDRALDYLQQGCAIGSMVVAVELRRDPLWASLRTDARFDALLKSLAPR